MTSLRMLVAVLAFPLPGLCADAQDTAFPPVSEQIPGPDCAPVMEWNSPGRPRTCTPAQIADWLADIRHWRMEHLIRMGYDGSQYDRPELRWTQSSFIQPQMMAHERYFYDPQLARYTVQRYLDDLKTRYGAIDSVLIWPSYPNLGIDDRNQFDSIRDMPGGLDGLRAM